MRQISIISVLAITLCVGCGARTPIAATYTVTYDGNGAAIGAVPVDATLYAAGGLVTVAGNTGGLTKNGYTFKGWNTQTNGLGSNYAQGTTFTMGTGNVILYVQWTTNPTYTITYDGNGHSGGIVPVDTTHYEEGSEAKVIGNTGALVKAGFTYAGWNTQADGQGTTYTQGQPLVLGAGNVTLYARWTTNPTYTVIYDGNGSTSGTAPVDTTNYEAGQAVTVLDNTGNLLKSGLNFAAWNTRADGQGIAYSPGQQFAMGSAVVTLYAQWTAGDYWKNLLTLPPQFYLRHCETPAAIAANGAFMIVGNTPDAENSLVLRVDESSLPPVTVAATLPAFYSSMNLNYIGNELYFSGVDEYRYGTVLHLVDSGGSLTPEDTGFPKNPKLRGVIKTTVFAHKLYAVGIDDATWDLTGFVYDTSAADKEWVALPMFQGAQSDNFYLDTDTDGTLYLSYWHGHLSEPQNITVLKLAPQGGAWEELPAFPGASGSSGWGFAVHNGQVLLAVVNADQKTLSGYRYTSAGGTWSDVYIPVFDDTAAVKSLSKGSSGTVYLQLCGKTVQNRCAVFSYDLTQAGNWYALEKVGFAYEYDAAYHESEKPNLLLSPDETPYYIYKMTQSAASQLSLLKYQKETALYGAQTINPVFGLPAGTYLEPQEVTLSSATQYATIYYTTDGSDPLTSMTRKVYVATAPLRLERTATVLAVAIKKGYINSSFVSAGYVVMKVTAPAFDVAAGAYAGATTVHLSAYPNDAIIYYTTDGTDPTSSGSRQQYADGVNLTTSTLIKAAGVKAGYVTSDITSASYFIFEPAFASFQGNIQDIAMHDGTLYVLTFDMEYEGGTSWIYKLNPNGTWSELVKQPLFWGKSFAFKDAIIYFDGFNKDDTTVSLAYKYESESVTQLGSSIECGASAISTITSYRDAVYVSCKIGFSGGTFSYDSGSAAWSKVSDIFMESPCPHNGDAKLYSISNSHIYKTDNAELLAAIPYSGLNMNAVRIKDSAGTVEILSITNGMFAMTAAENIYNNFPLPVLDALTNNYNDFNVVAGTYYITAPKTLLLVKNKIVKQNISLKQSDASLTRNIVLNGTLYYVVSGKLYTLTLLN